MAPRRIQNQPERGLEVQEKIKDSDTIESEFIGASEKDCEDWMLKEQDEVNFMDYIILFIADARSAKDDTIIASVYRQEQGVYADKATGLKVPPEPFTWFRFRIDFKEAWLLHCDVNYGPPPEVWPFYFARKDEATDEDGVFSVTKANDLIYSTKR